MVAVSDRSRDTTGESTVDSPYERLQADQLVERDRSSSQCQLVVSVTLALDPFVSIRCLDHEAIMDEPVQRGVQRHGTE